MGDDQRTIWCGNLPEKATEALLYELFLQAGPLQRVTIPMDRDGRQRPYAFITYKDECSVPYALSLFEDTKLFNRVLSLSMKGGKMSESFDRGANGPSYGNDWRIDVPTPQMASKDMALDFNMLLQLGQQMMGPMLNPISAPYMQNMMSLPMYASQMGGQNYLGGSLNTKNSNHGYQNSRNHPYAGSRKVSPGGNHGHNGYNQGHDGYRHNSRNDSKNYRSGRY